MRSLRLSGGEYADLVRASGFVQSFRRIRPGPGAASHDQPVRILAQRNRASYSRATSALHVNKGLLLAILSVTFLGSAFVAHAQDAASTPFRDTPPPSEPAAPQPPPAAETPTPTPVPRDTPVAKPPEQEQPAPAQVRPATAASPAAKAIGAPVRAVPARPAAPKRAAKPADADEEDAKPETRSSESRWVEPTGSISDIVKTLEKEWENAIANHDTTVISRVVANDFVGVSSSGRIGDKMTLLYEAKRDKNVYKSAAARQMSVHVYGTKVAVVLGVTKETGTTSSGRPFSHTFRFTDTWMERDGKWQCIAAHAAVANRR